VLLGSTADEAPKTATDAVAVKDQDAIQGEWRVTHFEEEGDVKAVPPEKLKSMRYVFSGGKAAIKIDGKVRAEGKFKLDSGKDPKHIDLDYGDGNTPGIYKLEGGRLTICCPAFRRETPRPKEFKTQKESGTMLMKLER